MELSFPPFDLIMDEKQSIDADQLLAEVWRASDLERFR